MTDPSWPERPANGWPPQPPPGYSTPYSPYPASGAYPDPSAPYGRHPVTGEALSDRSKPTAALLQLIGFFGILGVGRFYLGYNGLGVAQLITGLVTCGVVSIVWGIVDAILILTDKVPDTQGRPLRSGL
jgi:TM2 domain-containing membrane protein YozV